MISNSTPPDDSSNAITPPQDPYSVPGEFRNPNGPPPIPATPPPIPVTPWNGWWTLLWGVVVIIAWQTMTLMVLIIAFLIWGNFSSSSDPEELSKSLESFVLDGDIVGTATFLSIFIVCPLCLFIAGVRTGWTGWKYLGNKRVQWWQWPLWTFITLTAAFGFDFVAPYLGVSETDPSMLALAKSTQFPILLILGVAVGAPLIEEFIFRGLLFRGWRESRLGLYWTVILTSAIWAGLHLQYPLVLIGFIFVLGLILGMAREKTGSIWVPIFLHTLNNALATLHLLQLR